MAPHRTTTPTPDEVEATEAAYSLGYRRTLRLTVGLDEAGLIQARDALRARLAELDLGTTAYAVQLGGWTALHHRLTGAPERSRLRDRIQRSAGRGRRIARSCTAAAAGVEW